MVREQEEQDESRICMNTFGDLLITKHWVQFIMLSCWIQRLVNLLLHEFKAKVSRNLSEVHLH